jgi:Putative peptidoglycan binding domain
MAEKDQKGFSGLSSLVSDISDVDKSSNTLPVDNVPEQINAQSNESNQTIHSDVETTAEPVNEVSVPTQGVGTSRGKWIIGLIVLGIVIWAFNAVDNKKKPSYTHNPSAKSKISHKRIHPKVQPSNKQNSYQLNFEKPPVGDKNVLHSHQILWCLREKIRIEAIRNFITTNSKVEEFNRIVNDYNCRCGKFRYRRGSREQAKREIDIRRSQIIAKAIADFIGSQQVTHLPKTSLSKKIGIKENGPLTSNRQFILEAQHLLKSIGYDPGPADGQYGRRTANAVAKFQRHIGIHENGQINKSLLFYLQQYRTLNQDKIYFKNGKILVCEKAWKKGESIFVVCKGKQIAVGYPEKEIDMERSFGRK